MDNRKEPLHTDDHQDEYRCSVAHAVHKLVHFAEKIAKHPTEDIDNVTRVRDIGQMGRYVYPRMLFMELFHRWLAK